MGYQDPESINFLNENEVLVLAGELLHQIDLKTGSTTVVARGVQRVGLSEHRTEIAVATTKGALQLRRFPGYKVEQTLKSDFPFFVKLASDETLLIIGGGGLAGRKSIKLLSLPSGKLTHDLTEFRGGLFAASISHSGRSVLFAGGSYGAGGDLSAWSLPDGIQIGYRSFGRMPFESVDWAPDDSYFAAGSADGYVVVYRAADFRRPGTERAG